MYRNLQSNDHFANDFEKECNQLNDFRNFCVERFKSWRFTNQYYFNVLVNFENISQIPLTSIYSVHLLLSSRRIGKVTVKSK